MGQVVYYAYGVPTVAGLREWLANYAFIPEDVLETLEVKPDILFDKGEALRLSDYWEDTHLIAMRYRVSRAVKDEVMLQNELTAACNARGAFLESVAPWKRQSRTMTCKGCGKVLDLYAFMQYCGRDGSQLMAHACPHCQSWLLSATNMKKLHSFDAEIARLSAQLEGSRVGVPTDELAWFISYGYYD